MTYRLPREPSTPRITLWRRLRRLGAVQLLDGLVALPLDARNREQFEWIADDIVGSGGEASILLAELASAEEERQLADRMAASIAAEYAEIHAAAEQAAGEADARVTTVRRLRRRLRAVRQRDHFPPAERELAERAVDRLAAVAGTPR